jgi:hypothetical protein
MKKLSFLILIISIQVFSQTSVEEPTLKTVEEVLNFNKQAIGSEEDLNKLENHVIKSSSITITKTNGIESETNMKMVQVVTSDGKMVTTTSSDGNIVSKVVFNGDSGYTILPSLGHKQEFSPQQVNTFKNSAKLFHRFDAANFKPEVEQADVNGQSTYKLTKNDGSLYFFSKETGLLLKSFSNLPSVESTSFFNDYREVNGVTMSFQQESLSNLTTTDGSIEGVTQYEEVLFNTDVTPYFNESTEQEAQDLAAISGVTARPSMTSAAGSASTSYTEEQLLKEDLDESTLNKRDLAYREILKAQKDNASSSTSDYAAQTVASTGERIDVDESAANAAGSKLKYRRSSLYTLMIDDPSREHYSTIKNAFGNTELSDKFNDHNLGPYLMPGEGGEKDQTQFIENYLNQKNVAKKLVEKWFLRDENGGFSMDLIADRGQYNATDLNVKLAKESKRGMALLKDAGEELIGNTFVVVYDYKYTNKKEQAKKAGGFLNVVSSVASVAGADVVSDVADGANLAAQTMGKGYFVRTTTYLYRLVWDDETANTFYQDHWFSQGEENPEKKQRFDQSSLFKLKYVGSEISRTNLQSTVFSNKSDDQLIEVATTRAVDKNISKLQRTYEEFRVKTPLLRGDPICAKIGLKEGLEKGDKFEVLEQIINNDGETEYRRVGKIKVDKNQIWDNRFLSEEENEQNDGPEYTVFKGNTNKYASGMLIRQIN